MLLRIFFFIALVIVPSLGAQDRLAAVGKMVSDERPKLGSPGISVAVAINDELAWSAGYGMADVENDVPAGPTTVYRIGSISKPFGATAVMQLVERGKVNLGDPIEKYVPSFHKPFPISLRQIMTHTSGIRHYKPGEFENMVRFASIAEAIKIFKDDPLLFTPGAKYSYSTYAYNMLAGVVETASGISFEAYFDENILKPSGLPQTYLDHTDRIVPHRARPYQKGGNTGVSNSPYADLSIKWTGGGIISTVEDLVRFHIALNKGKLLKPETLELMYTPGTLADGTKINYGLGWNINTDARGRRWVAHGGGSTGGSSYLLRLPEAKFAVAIICNVSNAGNLRGLAMRIAETLLDR